jgi:hypothetical protein
MTAAIIATPQQGLPGAAHPKDAITAGRAAGGVIDRSVRRPYLMAVPESEPPFDDERKCPGPVPAQPSGPGPAQPTGEARARPTGMVMARPTAMATAPQLSPAKPTTEAVGRPTETIAASPTGRIAERATGGVAEQPTGQLGAPRAAAVTGGPGTGAPTSFRGHGTTLDGRAGNRDPAPARRGSIALLTAIPTRAGRSRPTTITAAGVPGWSSESDIGVRKTSTEQLPPADRTASMLARALVEMISGQRPLGQLRVHCAPEVYAGLAARPSAGPLALPHLLTVRVCEPADGVAEVSAAFRRADRVRAVAFRLQGVDGRWRITALQLG